MRPQAEVSFTVLDQVVYLQLALITSRGMGAAGDPQWEGQERRVFPSAIWRFGPSDTNGFLITAMRFRSAVEGQPARITSHG